MKIINQKLLLSRECYISKTMCHQISSMFHIGSDFKEVWNKQLIQNFATETSAG